MLSRFHRIPERDGQTDRQMDGQTDSCYIISRVSVLTTRDNKGCIYSRLQLEIHSTPSVCPSRSCILSKRIPVCHILKIFPLSQTYTILYRTTNHMAIIRQGPLGCRIQVKYEKNRYFRPIGLGYLASIARCQQLVRASATCYKQSAAGPSQVDDTRRWYSTARWRLLIVGDGRRSATRQ